MWLRGHSYLQPLVQSVDHSHNQTEKQKFFCVSGYQHSKNTDSKSDKYIKKSPAKKCKQKETTCVFLKAGNSKKSPRITHAADLTEAWSILAGEPQGWHIHTLHKAQAASTTAEHLISLTQPHCCWARVGRQKIKQTQ